MILEESGAPRSRKSSLAGYNLSCAAITSLTELMTNFYRKAAGWRCMFDQLVANRKGHCEVPVPVGGGLLILGQGPPNVSLEIPINAGSPPPKRPLTVIGARRQSFNPFRYTSLHDEGIGRRGW